MNLEDSIVDFRWRLFRPARRSAIWAPPPPLSANPRRVFNARCRGFRVDRRASFPQLRQRELGLARPEVNRME